MACKRLPDDYCQHCGALITRERCGKDSRKYCHKGCYFAAVREGKQQFKGRKHDISAALADWAYEWDARRPRPRKQRPRRQMPLCQTCGTEVNEGASRFCCDECMAAWRGDRPCNVCSSTVSGCRSQGKVSCRKCKTEAKRKYRKQYKRELGSHRKRVRKGGGLWNSSVRRSVVFAQDRYRCYLCRKKCKLGICYNDPLAATVDMVVPASKGGDWDYYNLRCACRRCNSLKSNKLVGQLTLRISG
jgi:hypothetical protein